MTLIIKYTKNKQRCNASTNVWVGRSKKEYRKKCGKEVVGSGFLGPREFRKYGQRGKGGRFPDQYICDSKCMRRYDMLPVQLSVLLDPNPWIHPTTPVSGPCVARAHNASQRGCSFLHMLAVKQCKKYYGKKKKNKAARRDCIALQEEKYMMNIADTGEPKIMRGRSSRKYFSSNKRE
jgi:hypothetical protein